MRREVNDAISARAVQAAEDVQAFVLAPVEVQAEDGREDEQHHGKIKHHHNGCLGRERQEEKLQIHKPSWVKSKLFLSILEYSPVSQENPCSKSTSQEVRKTELREEE